MTCTLNLQPGAVSGAVADLVSQVIDAADNDVLDMMHSRAAEQEVLDQLDEPASR